MDEIQIRIDASGMQRLAPTSEISLTGAYQCREITPYFHIGKILFRSVHFAKGRDDLLLAPTAQKSLIRLYPPLDVIPQCVIQGA